MSRAEREPRLALRSRMGDVESKPQDKKDLPRVSQTERAKRRELMFPKLALSSE